MGLGRRRGLGLRDRMSSGSIEVVRYRRGPSSLEDHRLVGKVDGEDMDVGRTSLRRHEIRETHCRACGHWAFDGNVAHTTRSEI
jgi:hypothetical protein